MRPNYEVDKGAGENKEEQWLKMKEKKDEIQSNLQDQAMLFSQTPTTTSWLPPDYRASP